MREPLLDSRPVYHLQLLAAPQALGETCPELPSIRAGSRDQTPNAVFAQGQHENSLVSGSI
ncbi:MAG: hypothetical protein E3J37_07915 [Anaerolineales bacterium]|nr:MAG: hypothetical protein E3J37_07915 [Anaerolineales bacterium]